VAFAVAELKLKPFLPGEVEDVAIETLEELVDKVREVDRVEELKPWPQASRTISPSAGCANGSPKNAARADGKPGSLQSGGDDPIEQSAGMSPLAALEQMELADLLAEIQSELKADLRAVLGDFFVHGLSYEVIARKHGLAIGSVGVYLKARAGGDSQAGRASTPN